MNALFGQTLLLYITVGVGVAAAFYVSKPGLTDGHRWFRMIAAIPFWPLFVPLLLSSETSARSDNSVPVPGRDEMMNAIQLVDTELDAAFGSLDGWAEHVLARERKRIEELRAAWIAQADRIREMDRLLELPTE